MDVVVKKEFIENFDATERQIRDSHKTVASLQETWTSLDKYFRNAVAADDRMYRWTYFRIYTEITWKLLLTMDREVISLVAMARQVPTALILDFDVWKEFLTYLNIRMLDKEEMEGVYKESREAFLTSSAYVGVWKGNSVTVQELIEDIKIINRPNADSLQNAEVMSKVKSVLVPQGDPLFDRYALTNPDQMVDRFIGLVNFFLGVEPGNIWYVVEKMFSSELYEVPEQSSESQVTSTGVSVASPVQLSEQTSSVTAEEKTPSMSYVDIRTMINSRFSKDDTGQFANIEGVLALLDSLATEYKDDQIRELYYFDESTGGFRWNDELTK